MEGGRTPAKSGPKVAASGNRRNKNPQVGPQKWEQSGNKTPKGGPEKQRSGKKMGNKNSQCETRKATKWDQSGAKLGQKTRGFDPKWAPKAGPGKFIFYPYTPSLSCHFSSKTASRYLIVTTRWTLHLQVLAHHYATGSHTPTWRRHLSVIMQAFPKDGAGGADGA